MDLISIFQKYPDHESCIEHLDNVRWGDKPICLHCGSEYAALSLKMTELAAGIAIDAAISTMFCQVLFSTKKQPTTKVVSDYLSIYLMLKIFQAINWSVILT